MLTRDNPHKRLPAVFCFQLKDSETTLQHNQTISLPDNANPLDVEYLSSSSPSPRLLVAVDSNSSTTSNAAKSIHVFSRDEQQEQQQQNPWRLTQDSIVDGPAPAPASASATAEDQEKPITTKELEKILYTTESLRKTASEFEW